MEPAMPEERIVYGCVGADRPKVKPYIVEVDGLLVHTCPECRQKAQSQIEKLAQQEGELDSLLAQEYGADMGSGDRTAAGGCAHALSGFQAGLEGGPGGEGCHGDSGPAGPYGKEAVA
jgi:hypothetical protein